LIRENYLFEKTEISPKQPVDIFFFKKEFSALFLGLEWAELNFCLSRNENLKKRIFNICKIKKIKQKQIKKHGFFSNI